MTWFKKDKNIHWFTAYDLSNLQAHIASIIG